MEQKPVAENTGTSNHVVLRSIAAQIDSSLGMGLRFKDGDVVGGRKKPQNTNQLYVHASAITNRI